MKQAFLTGLCGFVFAGLPCAKTCTMGIDLNALGVDLEAQSLSSGLGVPIHEGCVDFKDVVAVNTDNLCLEVVLTAIGCIVLEVLADIDFADDITFLEYREGSVDGCTGDRVIDAACEGKKFFCGVVGFMAMYGLQDGPAWAGQAQAFLRQEVLEAL